MRLSQKLFGVVRVCLCVPKGARGATKDHISFRHSVSQFECSYTSNLFLQKLPCNQRRSVTPNRTNVGMGWWDEDTLPRVEMCKCKLSVCNRGLCAGLCGERERLLIFADIREMKRTRLLFLLPKWSSLLPYSVAV